MMRVHIPRNSQHNHNYGLPRKLNMKPYYQIHGEGEALWFSQRIIQDREWHTFRCQFYGNTLSRSLYGLPRKEAIKQYRRNRYIQYKEREGARVIP